jgi:hypothetical protein
LLAERRGMETDFKATSAATEATGAAASTVTLPPSVTTIVSGSDVRIA